MRFCGRVGCHYILPALFLHNFINQLIAFSFTNLKSPLFWGCKKFFHYFYQRNFARGLSKTCLVLLGDNCLCCGHSVKYASLG